MMKCDETQKQRLEEDGGHKALHSTIGIIIEDMGCLGQQVEVPILRHLDQLFKPAVGDAKTRRSAKVSHRMLDSAPTMYGCRGTNHVLAVGAPTMHWI
eukprot:1338987-Amorphochlora_amoeboformis.AAC.2